MREQQMREEQKAKPESKQWLRKIFRRGPKAVIAVALLCCVLLTAAAAGARFTSGGIRGAIAAVFNSQLTTQATQQSGVQPKGVNAVMLRAGGFDPSDLVRPVGRFTLAVDKQSITEEVVLVMMNEDGSQREEFTVPASAPNWYRKLNLQTGRYTITVTNHPEWVCHITIQ